MASEAGAVFVSIIPSMRGFVTRVNRELRGIGDVNVTVNARFDAGRVREEAQAAADEARATVDIDADISRLQAQIGAAERRLADLGKQSATPQVRADMATTEAELSVFRSQLEDLNREKVSVTVGANTADATTGMATVEERANRLDGRKIALTATANVTSALASLSALAVATNGVAAKKIDLNLDRGVIGTLASVAGGVLRYGAAAGAASLGVAGLTVATGSLLNAVGSLGPLATAAVGGLALLPAIGLSGAAAVGTFTLGLLGVGDALKVAFDPTKVEEFTEALAKLSPEARAAVLQVQAMGPAWTALRLDVQNKLLAGAAGTLRGLADTYLPMANVGLGAMAVSTNRVTQEFLGWLMLPPVVAMMRATTDNVTAGFDALLGSVNPIGQAITVLAAVGSTQLVGIGNAITSVSEQFRDFIFRTAASGELDAFLANAVQQLGNLAQLVGYLGVIFIRTFQAASVYGANIIVTLRDIAGATASWMSSAQGMQVMVDTFGAIRAGMAAASPLLYAFGQALSQAILPAAGTYLPALGAALGALAPAMMPLGQIIAALLPIAAQLGVVFAQVLTAALQALAPILVALTPLIVYLAQALGASLISAITTLTPYLVSLATFMSEHPGLVLGVITVLGTLFTVWQALVSAVSFLLGPLMIARIGMATLGVSLSALLAPLTGAAAGIGAFVSRLAGGMGFMSLAGTLLRAVGMALSWLLRTILGALGPLGILVMVLGYLFTTNEQFRGAVMGLLGALGQLVGAVVAAVMPAFLALQPVLTVAAGVLGTIANGLAAVLVPILQVLAGWISYITPVLAPMVAIFLGIVAAVRLWAVAQAVLNVVLAANPIGLVVIAIAALVAGIVWAYQNVTWFRDMINGLWSAVQIAFAAIGAAAVWLWQSVFVPAWTAISTAVMWAWTNVIQPVVSFIDLALRYLGAIIFVVLVAPFLIAWNLISAGLSALWSGVIQPIFGFIQLGLQFLGAAFTYLWLAVIQPVWNGIATAITFAWAVISAIFNAIVAFIVGVFQATWNYLYANVIKPVWDAIVLVITIAWSIVSAIWNAIIAYITGIFQATWNYLVTGIIQPVWDRIVLAITFAWATIQAIWNAIIAFIMGVLQQTFNWLYTNVIKPVWDAIGNQINYIWTSVIRPAWDAIVGGLRWLGDMFQQGTDRIGAIWNTIRGMLARPINFMIDVVWNRGIVPAWNKVAQLVGIGPIAPLGLIPEFASGGAIDVAEGGPLRGPGTGTSDSMLARVSDGEFVVREKIAKRTGHFLAALNDGQPEAIQAAGGKYARAYGYAQGGRVELPRFAVGGAIDAAKNFARSMAGKPYIWGGAGPGGSDCSGFMSQITNVLRGRNPHSRLGSTATMPWSGFTRGLTSAFTIGNSKNTGRGIGHMAGTLAGENVESGSGHGPMIGGRALGSTAGLFPEKYSLPEVGGAFAPGAPGDGGGGFFDFISPLIRAAFDTLTNPAIEGIRRLVGAPPPEWRAVPPALATKARDTLREFLLSKVAAVVGVGQGTGGAPIGDVGGLNARQRAAAGTIIGIAKSRGMPRKAAEIGVATAMQESQLGMVGMYRATDHDSLGLFQQRPSTGWGTPAQITNDTYATNKFFDALARINYMGMAHTNAAQAVQRSAFPNAYAKWVPLAISAVNAFPGGYDQGGLATGSGIMLKETIQPERVLSPRQTAAFEELVPILDGMRPTAASLTRFDPADFGPGPGRGTGGGSGAVRITGTVRANLADNTIEFIDARLDAVTDEFSNGRRP